jgi:hypothetical protein
MKRFVLISIMAIMGVAGCTSPEDEGGTAIPSAQTGAPLADEAVGPSDQESKIDE